MPFPRSYITLSILGFAAALVAVSCSHRSSYSLAGRYSYPDSITVDSTTLWQERAGSDKVTVTAYVLDTVAALYTLEGDQLHFDTVLSIGDAVQVTKAPFGNYFENKLYPVTVDGHVGYMHGSSLGFGFTSDFDNDGKDDLIIYGYSHYAYDTTMETPYNPLSIKFVSATGAVSELHDTVTSDLQMHEVGDVRLSKKVHVYELNAGYPACGYPQTHFIIAYGNGKAEAIHRSVTSVDGAYGDYCEFYYPSDSAHHIDTIYISHRLAQPLSDSDDTSVVTHTTDSTILYLHEGHWGEHNYKLDPNSN